MHLNCVKRDSFELFQEVRGKFFRWKFVISLNHISVHGVMTNGCYGNSACFFILKNYKFLHKFDKDRGKLEAGGRVDLCVELLNQRLHFYSTSFSFRALICIKKIYIFFFLQFCEKILIIRTQIRVSLLLKKLTHFFLYIFKYQPHYFGII